MANEEQLAILRQGVEVWNQWRNKEPRIKIDLVEADLNGANLHKVNLIGADLNQAKLTGTDLT